MDYFSVRFKYAPVSETVSNLLAAFLADIGFESFVGDENGLTAYIPATEYDKRMIDDLLSDFPIKEKFEVSEEFIKGKDWNEEWEKNYFQPIMIDERCVVHSSFHKEVAPAEYDIVIDPKMAFGTGHHATTSMMLRHILSLDLTGKTVIDMGTGTGILSILSKMRGASAVTGIEIDPDAAENARENALLNKTDIEILTGDSSSLAELEKADLFLANINRNVILADLKRYAGSMKGGSIMFLSGFYKEDVALIEKSAAFYGLRIEDVTTVDDGWTSLKMIKE